VSDAHRHRRAERQLAAGPAKPSEVLVRRSVPIRGGGSDAATRQREALAEMDEFERITGRSLDRFATDQAAQRARVRSRYGLDQEAA
jgi:hypothetical protein